MTSGYMPSLRYNFAGFTLEHDSRRLFRRGEEVYLPPLSSKLLLALVARAPETLTYGAIGEEVWDGRHVSHSTITQRVKLLRGALGDDADEPVYVALVRGIGYRFIPSVERVAAAFPKATPANAFGVHRRAPGLVLLMIVALVPVLWAGMRMSGEGNATAVATSLGVPVQARKSYELGKVLYHRRGAGDVEQAREHFHKAIALAPQYPDPWVLLAGIYRIMAEEGQLTFEEARQREYEALTHALVLQPDLVEAQVRLAGLEWAITGSNEALQRRVDLALAEEPQNALALYKQSELLRLQGDWEQALVVRERAAAQHPTSLAYQGNLAIFYLLMARFNSAEETLNLMLDIHPNQAEHIAREFAQLRLLQSRPSAALKWATLTQDPRERLALQSMAYHLLDQPHRAHAAVKQLRADRSPISQVKALEIEFFIDHQRVSVDQTLTSIAEMTVGYPEHLPEARMAMDHLLHSPFLGWSQRREQWAQFSRQVRETGNLLVAADVSTGR